MTMKEKIINDIENNSIILYMKGTQERPMCGFSAKVVNTLNSHSVVFQDINILEDPEIRVRLSEYSNWPTIPHITPFLSVLHRLESGRFASFIFCLNIH